MEVLEDTTAQRDADRVSPADVKVRCASIDKQLAERSKERCDETKKVSEALKILTDDDARDLMSRPKRGVHCLGGVPPSKPAVHCLGGVRAVCPAVLRTLSCLGGGWTHIGSRRVA